MQSFIEEILKDVLQKEGTIENLIFILPSKRAGIFLKNNLAQTVRKTVFVPEIYSIENFVEKISGLRFATNTEQLFELYATYLNHIPGEKDNFSAFSKWGQTLLQDFNEIDRHLIDPSAIFSNLTAIQEINHWSLQSEKTQMMENYLRFWKDIQTLYHNFNQGLLKRGLGHQGLVYRYANDNLEEYRSSHHKTYIFMGFNALNAAENQIIQSILSSSKAYIYWDIDSYFLEDPIHAAGYFIRKYLKYWNYFQKNSIKGVSSYYGSEKDIQIIGVPKNISQAKYVGNLLKKMQSENADALKTTAVVLGDETLLNPLLNAVPQEIEAVNITMGYPLHKTPLGNLFGQFIDLYLNSNEQGWYHQNIISFLSHPYIHLLLNNGAIDGAAHLSQQVKTKNLIYIRPEKIGAMTRDIAIDASFLFFKNRFTPIEFVEKCLALILKLKSKIEVSGDLMALEYLYRFHGLFNQILDMIQKHAFISDLKSLQSLYKELLSNETLDFQGDPLEGLQIMGMLESRNLDFETVIITSVNEGILPSGKSNNSFIPFDLKINFGLPTYKEKDAVYTYHFYRLLQRAKNIYILYNTEPDVLEGGEKSRLITQLLTDENKSKYITEIIAMPKIEATPKILQTVSKDVSLSKLIEEHASVGFSPSSLSTYIRNPIDFYKRHLLGIEDTLEVEETVASNTFGTIVHDVLEELYSPFVGKYLSGAVLNATKSKINDTVRHHFAKSYMEGDISRGKNLIAFNVVKRYLENFIDFDIKETLEHKIKIIGLEEKLKLALHIPEVDSPIFLKGKLDRIDEIDGVIRIIDYKTGKVTLTDVEIIDWQDIIMTYDHNKAFQLLCYALMYRNKNTFDKLEAGIISFKALNSGVLKFGVKDKKGSRNKDNNITDATLAAFQTQLNTLILEIFNPKMPFTEKDL